MSTLSDWSAVNDHIDNIVTYLQSLLPKSVSVDTYGGRFNVNDLMQYATKAPALKISLLRLRTITANTHVDFNSLVPTSSNRNGASKPAIGGTQVVMNMTISITILTRDDGSVLPRYKGAINLAQFISMVLPHQRFNSELVTPVSANIDVRNLFNAEIDKNKKIALWGAAFDQQITVPLEKNLSSVPEYLFFAENTDGDSSANNYQRLTEPPEA